MSSYETFFPAVCFAVLAGIYWLYRKILADKDNRPVNPSSAEPRSTLDKVEAHRRHAALLDDSSSRERSTKWLSNGQDTRLQPEALGNHEPYAYPKGVLERLSIQRSSHIHDLLSQH